HDYADPPRTVDDLIARCGKPSRRHLERAFHQSVRASPYQFMLKQRVTNAQKLLRSTEQSIERIAEAAGFSNPPQLCLHFRKLTGQSPSQYRAAERREQAARNPEA
ncbi:MAG: helix-turn-helix transcriptional regulator, partial [Verrucomicrobiota bacterium]